MKKRRYLLSLKSLEKKSKASLLRLIMKHLKTKSKKSLARLAYSMAKSKLPRLERKAIQLKGFVATGHMTKKERERYLRKGQKPKRKFSPKQLAAQRLFAKRAKAGTLRRTKFKRKYGRLMS